MLARWREETATQLKRWIGGQKPIGVFVGRRLGLGHLPRPRRLVAGLVVPAQPPARRALVVGALLVVLAPLVTILAETPIAGLATLATIPLLVPLSLLLRGARLVFFAEHFEVQKGKRALVLPYTLFRNARHVPGDYGDVVLIDPRGLTGVELREGERTVARGQGAKLALVSFVSAGELRLPDMFGTPSTEIVDILALLASAHPEPVEEASADGIQAERLGIARLGPRTVRAPASLLRFPPRCLLCEGRTQLGQGDVTASHPAWAVLAVLGVPGEFNSTFVAPTCAPCREAAEERRKRACLRRALVGMLVALGCSAPLYLLPLDRFVARFLLPMTVLSLGGVIGWFTGYPAGRLVPATTDWRARLVTLTLPSEAYAEETVTYSSRPRG